MPAKSKQQQKFMGIVRAIQKGEAPAGKFSKSAQKAAKSMKKSSVRKYAKTKHDELPKKVEETVYQFKSFTNNLMDELDALLYRAGIKGKPDFNKMTYTTGKSNPKLDKLMKMKGGKKIKEDKDDEEKWSGIGYDSFESIKEKKNPKDVYDYLVYVRKYKPDLWNNLKKKKDIQKIMKKFESVKESNTMIKLKDIIKESKKEKIKLKSKWKHNKLPWMRGPAKKNESDLPTTSKKEKTIKVKHKKSGKTLVIVDKPVVRKQYQKLGYFAESINEAPGKSGKDQYVGQARVKVEPYTYKNQKRNYHDVSMYRDHKKPYHYYLSIKLAHSNKVDMVVDTGTHIQSKAGKWAQGFIKRRMDGTGKERFQ